GRDYGCGVGRVGCYLHDHGGAAMPGADAETPCEEGILQRVTLPDARNMTQALVRRVNVLAETDWVRVGIRPARRHDDRIVSWDEWRLDKQRVRITAPNFEAVVICWRRCTVDRLVGEVGRQ